MHILIIPSERYVTPEEPLAGIFQHQQAHALNRTGLEVGLVAPMPRSLCLLRLRITGWPRGIEFRNDEGIPTYRYQGWRWIPGRVPYLSSSFYILLGQKLFEKYAAMHGLPDIIHAHNVLYGGVIANAIKARYGVPFVLTEHSSAYLSGRVRKWQVPMVKEVLKNADARLVVSPYLGHALEKRFGQITQPWHWVPNVLDATFEEQNPLEGFGQEEKDQIRILTIGSLIPIKNHEGLLKAFAKVFKGRNKIQLRVGGSGPLGRKLENLANRLQIRSQVIFLGALNREQVLNEMHHCDIFVLPSHHETFGAVLIEALACGKPVIATDSGGPRSIVHDGNGLLVASDDDVALANAMQRMLQDIDRYDPKSIHEDCVNRFGTRIILNRLIDIYSRILANRLGKEVCNRED